MSTLGPRNFGISLKCGLAFNFYFNIALKFERFPQVCADGAGGPGAKWETENWKPRGEELR